MKNSYRSGYLNKLDGGGVLYERDVLNIILSNAYGGRDMSDIADGLLERFPSIGAILSADVAEITAVKGVSERVALYLKTLALIGNYNPENGITEIRDRGDFLTKATRLFGNCDNEVAKFYLVNARGKVVGYREYTSDSTDSVRIPTDGFLTFITGTKAYGLYCAHNHVDGSDKPSNTDDIITERIAVMCSSCNVVFLDHVIINASNRAYSYALDGKSDKITQI